MPNGRLLVAGSLILLFLVSCAALPQKRGAESSWEKSAFPILPWELPPRILPLDDPTSGLASMRECGFTTAAFVRPEDLKHCRKLGLKALVRPEPWRVHWWEMTDQQIDRTVKELVEQSQPSDAVLGYFIADEPGVKQFAGLAKAVAAVKKYAPGKLAYINLYPNYATLGAPDMSQIGTTSYHEYLERYVREVRPQFISYDNYRVLFSNDLENAKRAADYYTNLLAVREVAQEHELPFWVVGSSNEIRPFTPVPSPANLLFQAYTTLAAGARGMTWFTYYTGAYHHAPIDRQGHRTLSWSYLRMVNAQLQVLGPIVRKLKSTGVYFTSPAPVASLPVLPGKVIEKIESATPVMVGEFAAADGGRYAMVVNLSLEKSSKLTITTKGGGKIRAVSAVDGSVVPLQTRDSLWLTAGQGVLLKL